MDDVSDEADGIGDTGFGFGFGFEKTFPTRGGFERESFGFQLLGAFRGKYSFENDGSHILVGITNSETIHSNNDEDGFVKSISTTLRT